MDNSGEISSEHQLWINLSSFGDGNVFAVLPELMKKMLYADAHMKSTENEEFDAYTLPSDYEWQTKIYFKMVEKQRRLAALPDENKENEMPVLLRNDGVTKLHDWNIKPKPAKQKLCPPEAKRLIQRSISSVKPVTWTVSDIAKAGCLLTTPPISTHFDDEQEMRRVYTLIYDVFRYKNILNRALSDVSFFLNYPELKNCIPLVWLLLFDLYHRGFKKRETGVAETAADLFRKCGLTIAETALWFQRIKLAAAVARLRIEHSALNLTELLPRHLRDERITSQAKQSPVTCWVNVKKVKNTEEINREILKLLNIKLVDDYETLQPDTFKWDTLCPQFMVFHPSVRTKLAQSSLVRKHKLIVQDRSFCVGPATFGKLVENLQLTGSVIQSHVNSPRATAYLGALLSQNEKIKKLVAFSAGHRKQEYEHYFNELGMNNITIYADKLVDVPPDSFFLQEAIAVFATPPNSYSAVTDPIDLVCSRGGDLSMLEVLTETEETTEGRQRVLNILEEQRNTLRFAMSRPQIQFVLYETHSELEAENNGMVQKAMREINKLAKMHHAALQGKLNILSQSDILSVSESQEINNNEDSSSDIKLSSIGSKTLEISTDNEDKILKDVTVPECDLFDMPSLPDLCPNGDYCLKLSEEGCFLALLQRKQVTRMDNKYLIQIAESRGLFGSSSGTSGRTKGSKGSKKKQERVITPPLKIKRRIKTAEINRIATNTQAFIRHTAHSHDLVGECPRMKNEEDNISKVPQTRRWWIETTRHITQLRSSLIKQKILPPIHNFTQLQASSKTFVNSLVHATHKIDELATKSQNKSNIPVFPKLRLTKNNKRSEKIPLPVTVTIVEFPFKTRYT